MHRYMYSCCYVPPSAPVFFPTPFWTSTILKPPLPRRNQGRNDTIQRASLYHLSSSRSLIRGKSERRLIDTVFATSLQLVPVRVENTRGPVMKGCTRTNRAAIYVHVKRKSRNRARHHRHLHPAVNPLRFASFRAKTRNRECYSLNKGGKLADRLITWQRAGICSWREIASYKSQLLLARRIITGGRLSRPSTEKQLRDRRVRRFIASSSC